MTPAQRKCSTLTVPVVTSDDPLDISGGAKSESKEPTPRRTNVAGVAVDRLRSIVERIERLNAEKKSLSEDIAEIKKEAKGSGFDVKAINCVIKLRAQDKDDADELQAIVDTYSRALGMKP